MRIPARRVAALALLAATIPVPASAIDPLGVCARAREVTYEVDPACAYLGRSGDLTARSGCAWQAMQIGDGAWEYVLYNMSAVVRFAAEVKVGCSVGDHYAETSAPGGAVTLLPAHRTGLTGTWMCEHVWARFPPANPHGYDPNQTYVMYGRCFEPEVTHTDIPPWRIVTPS